MQRLSQAIARLQPVGRGGVRSIWHGVYRRRRQRALSLHLGSEDLFDPLRNIRVTAVTCACRHNAPLALSATEVGFDRLSGEFRNGRAAPLGFVPETGVKVVGELHGRPFHGMPASHLDSGASAPPFPIRCQPDTFGRRNRSNCQRGAPPSGRFGHPDTAGLWARKKGPEGPCARRLPSPDGLQEYQPTWRTRRPFFHSILGLDVCRPRQPMSPSAERTRAECCPGPEMRDQPAASEGF